MTHQPEQRAALEGFLREGQIRPALLPVGRTTFWRMQRQGRFPPPLRLGPRLKVWRAADVRDWLAAQGSPNATGGV